MGFSTSRHASRYNNQSLKKGRFFLEMEKIIPRESICREIEQRYKKSKVGRPRLGTLLMIKIYFLQQRFDLSDPGLEEEIYDRISFQKFLDIDILKDQIPDESSILRFRHFLEEHKLQKRIFRVINKLLEEKNILIKEGTTVDATIIRASSSTKNKDKKRDPEMASTFKNKNAYFGMKIHAGTDSSTGLIHTLTCTSANEHDITQLEKLLHGKEKKIYGDSAYMSKEKTKFYKKKGVSYRACLRGSKHKKLGRLGKQINTVFAKVRAKGEHAFRVIKHQRKHKRVRYRGLYKNEMQRYALAGLSNLYMARKVLFRTT